MKSTPIVWKRTRLLAAVVAAAAGLTVAVVLSAPGGDGPKPLENATPISRDADLRAQDEMRAADAERQAAFLEEFQREGRDWSTLPIVGIPASSGAMPSLEELVAAAGVIVVAEVVNVAFESSKLDGAPATRTRYRVIDAFKGELRPGDTVDTLMLGGPYLAGPDNVVLTVLPGLPIHPPGTRVLAPLTRNGAATWAPAAAGASFVLDDGRIVSSPDAETLGIAGKTPEELQHVLE